MAIHYQMLASIRNSFCQRAGLQNLITLLFIGAFVFLRSFDLVALQPNTDTYYNNAATQFDAGHLNAGLYFQHYVASIPADQAIETQEEKDETHPSLEPSLADQQNHYLLGSQAMALSVKIRLRQNDASLHQPAPIPCFILHHSWKTFLS